MKKSLLMMSAAMLALASCSNEEVVNVADSRAISFEGTGISNITRAESDITSQKFDHFTVYGGYEGENAGSIFDGVKVNKPEGGQWGYTETQYWVAGTWKFAAYEGGNGVTPTWDYNTGLTLDVNSDANHQSDVVYAASAPVTLNEGDVATYSTPVSLEFSHILSKIQFRFAKDGSTLGDNVKVTLSNFKVAGIPAKCQWVAGNKGTIDEQTKSDYTDFATATEIDNENGLSTAEYYVIPQNVQDFEITVSAVVTDAAGAEIHSGNITATVPTTDIQTWNAQNYYVYTATLSMDNIEDPDQPGQKPKPIVFEGTTNDWEEVQTGTINTTVGE